MKTLIRYGARDGSEWKSAGEANARDMLLDAVARATSHLAPRPGVISYENGDGFVQQAPEAVLRCKRQLLELLDKIAPSYGFASMEPDKVHSMGIAGRIAADCSEPISRAWYRLMCMDDRFREWGQPYYATHPGEGVETELAV